MTPLFNQHEVESLYAFLNQRGWVKVHECCLALNLPTTEAGRRIIRACSNVLRCACGNEGIALLHRIPRDEAEHSVARLKSQVIDMSKRANDMERILRGGDSAQLELFKGAL
jgi:hypothetical protein